MSRTLVLVSGTTTEIGKTFVAARALEHLKQTGIEVHARKPVQSFDPGEGPTDAQLLAAASGENEYAVCPAVFHLPLPMAPPMAAAALGRPPFAIADLVAAVTWPSGGVVFVEAAGGPRSPLAADGDTVDLAAALQPDATILVAVPELGVINDVLLCAGALGRDGLIVFLNRFDPDEEIHVRNQRWLQEIEGLTVASNIDELVASLPVPVGTT